MAQAKPLNVVGRRKTSSARVHLYELGSGEEGGEIVVNKKPFADYFPTRAQQKAILQPLEQTERLKKYNFKVRVNGGGVSGQAGAVIHGLARALEKVEPELRPQLKSAGFLTRDAREVERKKPGRHKARKKPQFSKR